ncbi:PAP fimbrial minor pilin protein precursor [Serratia fonticola]|uniref:fimbrial protein n=1 Tax=Serratia fonticola TaxID=47917 RepID=UPI00217A734E|nr:fimbrial protein [Serratia fonticola]CAI2045316.1 PAP fimbrial minor pilin protein precursor [Serratia fonticola]
MRIRGFSILLLYLLTLPVTSWANSQGLVRVSVRMQGSIINTPCAIAVASSDQSIEMPTLPIEQIMRDGYGPARPFSIGLMACFFPRNYPNSPDGSTFRMTFEGQTTNDSLFAVSGQARGVGLQISDVYGNIALPSKHLSLSNLHSGDMTLNYNVRLVGDKKVLKAGPYHSSIRFKLDYY